MSTEDMQNTDSLPKTVVTRKFATCEQELEGFLPICKVQRIDNADARDTVRIADSEALYEICQDVSATRQMLNKMLEKAYGANVYTEHLKFIKHCDISNAAVVEVGKDFQYEYGSLGNRLRSTSYSNARSSSVIPMDISEVKPWYTMLAVLWQGKKIFGFRLYDWLLNTTADYDVASITEQVKNRTVKITNLDWLVDARAKSGALRCTQGNYEDYTALDISGEPIGMYHPLVILGYCPADITPSEFVVTFMDYKGNPTYISAEALNSDASRSEALRELVLTRGIANAVISVAQKQFKGFTDDITVDQKDCKELINQYAKRAVSSLELEPFQQDRSAKDTYQSVLGYVNYKCRANVFRRLEWATDLETATGIAVSTLMTVYDAENNMYIQVPYLGMHIHRDTEVSTAENKPAYPSDIYNSIIKLATALNYKDTFYPLLARRVPDRLFDNCGREVLLCPYRTENFVNLLSCSDDSDLSSAKQFQTLNASYLSRLGSRAGTISVVNDRGITEDAPVFKFSLSSIMLFNPGVVFPLCKMAGKAGGSVTIRYSNRYNPKVSSRYDYELDCGAPVDVRINSATTTDMLRLNSNIASVNARAMLTSSAGKKNGVIISNDNYLSRLYADTYVPEEAIIYPIADIGYAQRINYAGDKDIALLISGTDFDMNIDSVSSSGHARLILNPKSTICEISLYVNQSMSIDNIVSDDLEYLGCLTPNMWRSQDIVLQDSIQVLGRNAFKGTKIKSVKLPANLKAIGVGCFSLCQNLTKIELPEGLEVIGAQAFSACVGLKKLIIPASVKIIHSAAFADCYGLEDVIILGDPMIANNAFKNTPAQVEAKVYSNHKSFDFNTKNSALKEELLAKCNIYR